VKSEGRVLVNLRETFEELGLGNESRLVLAEPGKYL